MRRKREQLPPRGMAAGRAAAFSPLAIPGAALLMTVGLVGYTITSGTASDRASVQFVPVFAQNAPVVTPVTSNPSHIRGDAAGTSGSLEFVAGAYDVTGNFAVAAGWIKNLSTAAAGMGAGNLQALFAANEFNLGADTYVPQFIVAGVTGSGTSGMRIAFSSPHAGSSGNALAAPLNQAALDFPIIIFPANSAKLSASSLPLLRRVAAEVKQLPAGTLVELNGYTYGKANTAFNDRLSRERAEAVYKILIGEGVSPAMLSLNGHGGSPALASANGTMEGRSSTRMDTPRQDRRVEFRIIQQHP